MLPLPPNHAHHYTDDMAISMTGSFVNVTLLERNPVLDRLHDLLDDARNERGKTVLIHGEVGIGKTSVIEAFTRLHESDAHILWAGCDDLLASRPLGPVWDLAADEPQLTQALDSENRLAVFRSIIDLLQRGLRPTVLVIEDIQWADEATLDLVKYVGRRIDRTSGLLVLSYRDELTAEHPLRALLGDLPQAHVERLQLHPLSKNAVGQLVSDGTRFEHIWRISRGNPFYVSELASSDSDSVPESIKDVIKATWSRMSPPARNLIELVSVAPNRLRLAVLRNILGDATNLITECEGSGILEVIEENIRFRHELTRQAIEEDLAEVRRRKLNRLVLEASEALGEELSRCAHHARQAKDQEAILRLLPKAAQKASNLESHREALTHLRALKPYLAQMSPRQLADHYQLWAWEQFLDDPGPADEIAEESIIHSRATEDPVLLGRALLFSSRVKWINTNRAAAETLAKEAVDILRDVGGEDLAMAYASMSELAMLAGSYDETHRWADLALAHADEGPSYARAQALVNRGTMRAILQFPDGVSDLEDAYRTGIDHGFWRPAGRAVNNLAEAALQWRRLDLAEPWIRRGLELSHEHEWTNYRYGLEAIAARSLEMRGEWPEATTKASEVLSKRSVHTLPSLNATLVKARLLVRTGDPEARNMAIEAWERAKRNDEVQQVAPAGAIIAEHAWLGTKVTEETIQELVATLQRCMELRLLWDGGDLAQYLALLGVIDEVPDALPFPYVALDRGDWEQAAAFWRERGNPYEEAVALNQGNPKAKMRALELLDELGAKPLAARVRRQLQDAGLTGIPRGPYAATREHPLGLTPRQTEVLELLDQELTNEEIADRLFLSIRTVENHVSAILTKLSANNRKEAVELAREAQVLS
jgi:ATP/maltotriose-dependent transcriptional regulator MalT